MAEHQPAIYHTAADCRDDLPGDNGIEKSAIKPGTSVHLFFSNIFAPVENRLTGIKVTCWIKLIVSDGKSPRILFTPISSHP
jgi:hypothetical protein